MAASLLNRKFHNHARSNSFPIKPHPLILQCNEHLAKLGSFESSSSSSLLSLKLRGLHDLHVSIENLVQLSTTQEALAKESQGKCVDGLLDGSLRLLDACTCAKEALLHMKECTREIHSTIRRRRRGGGEMEIMVEAKKFLTSRKVVKKAIWKALGNLKGVNNCNSLRECENMALVSLLKDGEVVTLLIFESLLCFISGSAQSKLGSWNLVSRIIHGRKVVSSAALEGGQGDNEFTKLDAELQSFVFNMERKSEKINDLQNQLEKLDCSINELEEVLDSLFRLLIKIRVSLLNIINL